MTQDHAGHKYGFFKEVAPRYHKELLGELSLIKNQEHSISNALGEIVAVENSVVCYVGKCQDDIDHAFEEMFSVLEGFNEAVDTKSCRKIAYIIVWWLSESATLRAGNGCIEAT